MKPSTETAESGVGTGEVVGAKRVRRLSWDAKIRMLTRRVNKAVQRIRERSQYLDGKGYSGAARELLDAAADVEAAINKGPNIKLTGDGAQPRRSV